MTKAGKKNHQCIIAFLIICVCTVCGVAVSGVEIKKAVNTELLKPLEVEEFNVPPAFQKEVASASAVVYKTTICIHLIRSFIGALFGGIIGLFLVLIMRNKLRSTKEVSPTGLFSARNILYIVFFLLLFGIIWFISLYAIIRKVEPLPDIRFKIIAKYLALFSVAVSWLAVGRKIRFGQSIPRILHWLLLGPFNYIRLALFNSQQHKILWIGFVLIVFLVLFPPWFAYRYAICDKGHGDSEFVGFHFVFSDRYDVLYDAPYIVTEVDSKMQLLLIVGITICTFLCVLYSAIKAHGTMDQKDGEADCP